MNPGADALLGTIKEQEHKDMWHRQMNFIVFLGGSGSVIILLLFDCEGNIMMTPVSFSLPWHPLYNMIILVRRRSFPLLCPISTFCCFDQEVAVSTCAGTIFLLFYCIFLLLIIVNYFLIDNWKCLTDINDMAEGIISFCF